MKKRTMILAMIALMFTTGTGKVQAAEETSGLTIKPLTEKSVDANPYMVKNDANIHHDCYNTDTTDEVLPLAIYPEIHVSYEKSECQRFSGDLF